MRPIPTHPDEAGGRFPAGKPPSAPTSFPRPGTPPSIRPSIPGIAAPAWSPRFPAAHSPHEIAPPSRPNPDPGQHISWVAIPASGDAQRTTWQAGTFAPSSQARHPPQSKGTPSLPLHWRCGRSSRCSVWSLLHRARRSIHSPQAASPPNQSPIRSPQVALLVR